ncbi:Tat pathway signal protein [Candidatus Nitrosocosmicus arcticus]|uniref:Tat (Twin-arginine translocation) pathway signal sequence domain protein n=1 Tax=Candidatus Nitrosocosmicus arcticus TaxID=2035267 RepID=A0A557STZ5_9ARCH|nr:Tat pathway signal protein [Candidatus Nitrosocosmicus arcticus]TVP40073.1 Tat (Twin-arginine translocation) pathway signal sequence domain protein [Candidatus Nitrosocosmicus arcticus]
MVTMLPPRAKLMLALREHRMHHVLWHTVRDNWEREVSGQPMFSDSEKQRIRDMGWEPPRPSLNKDGVRIENNKSGEDFLFMHRQMILHVDTLLSEIGDASYPKVEGWTHVPPPNDPDYPVPVWNSAPDFIKPAKTDNFYSNRMVRWENDYSTPEYLSELTLGQLGSRLEYTIHNAMHLRWASDPGEERPLVFPSNADTIETRWDNPSYDYLADPYSSHVNYIFWKLHGWIDDRINDWMRAHEITGEVPWSVEWDKNIMPQHGLIHEPHLMARMGDEMKDTINRMEEVAKIVSKTDLITPFSVIDDGIV